MLQKYTKTPKNLYCTFCSSVGHDDNHYWALHLMMDITQDVYAMQSEQQTNPTEAAQNGVMEDVEEDLAKVEGW